MRQQHGSSLTRYSALPSGLLVLEYAVRLARSNARMQPTRAKKLARGKHRARG